jgi:hypothetical protein
VPYGWSFTCNCPEGWGGELRSDDAVCHTFPLAQHCCCSGTVLKRCLRACYQQYDSFRCCQISAASFI